MIMGTTRACRFEIATRPAERPTGDYVRRFLSIFDVAAYCGVLPDDVLDWIECGMLEATHIPPRHYRIVFGDLLVLLQKLQASPEEPQYLFSQSVPRVGA